MTVEARLDHSILVATEIFIAQGARIVTIILSRDVTDKVSLDFSVQLQTSTIIVTSSSKQLEVTEVILDSVIMVFGTEPGEDDLWWVSRLPKKHKTIFVMGGNWDLALAQVLGQFPRPLFIHSPHLDSNNASSSLTTVYRKPHYFKDHLEKMAIFHVNTKMLTDDQDDMVRGLDLELELDFGGHEFPAVAFEFYPYSMPDFEGQSQHGGYEYDIVAVLADALNLRLVIRPPSSGIMWGREDPPGSGNFTGWVD